MSLPGAPASDHGELGFTAVDSAGRSVGAGWRNRPALPVLGLCQREGVPLGRVSSAACRVRAAFSLSSEASKQPRHDSRHRGRDPGLAASGRGLVQALGEAAKAVLSRSCPTRKDPASFSRRRTRIRRSLRACWVISTLVGWPRIDDRVCRCSGLDLRDVFPTGCVEGRAERAARAPGRGLRRWAELDRSRPQPVVDGVECFDQLVVPWLLRIE